MLYALGAAVIWGALCGLFHAPFWVVAIGGLGAAALAVRLEWDALASPQARQRANFPLLLAAAFVFLAIIGVGVTSLGYFLGEWLLPRLPRF
jgi:hypothetical protein